MSQDIFKNLEENSESEDDPKTPVEFSGVSGSGGSGFASPLSQPQPAPKAGTSICPYSAGKPGPSSAQNQGEVFVCSLCHNKSYKTRRGYERHMMDKHEVGCAPAACSYAGPALQSSSLHQGAIPVSQSGFHCLTCQKTLKTRSGFVKHQATHKLNEANSRKPLPAEFKMVQVQIIEKIVAAMLTEPAYGEKSALKLKFLNEFLSGQGAESEFVTDLSQTICSFVCDKHTKILPLNQYEEAQQKLNVHLNNNDTMEMLKLKLMSACNQQIDSVLAGRIVSRIAFKLIDEIQQWVFSEMRGKKQDNLAEPEELIMSVEEEKAFHVTLGNIFRAFFTKGLHSSSRLWQSQSACIKDTFVLGPKPLSSAQFLDKNNWFSGNETSLLPSENASNFFKCVENIVNVQFKLKLPTPQEVIEEVLINTDALHMWFYLTTSHFSEEDSLLFMRELIYSYVRVSARLEDKRKNRKEEKSVRESIVPLRTHLQKNYSEKDESEVLD